MKRKSLLHVPVAIFAILAAIALVIFTDGHIDGPTINLTVLIGACGAAMWLPSALCDIFVRKADKLHTGEEVSMDEGTKPLIRLSPVHLIVTLAATVLGTILGGVATGLLAGCLCISPAIIDPQPPEQKGDRNDRP